MDKKMCLVPLIVILILFQAAVSRSDINANAGTTGAQFLKIGVGARAVAMGETFAGLADDVNAIYWNPAGLGQVRSKQFTGSHMMMFQGINYEFLAFGMPVGEKMTAGCGVSYVDMGELEARESDTEDYTSFGANDLAVVGAVGMNLGGGLGAGASIKYIRQTVSVDGNYTGTGFGIDAGVHYNSSPEGGKGVLAGACIQNIGTGITFTSSGGFEGEKNAMPFNIKAGIAYKDTDNNWTMCADVNIPKDNYMNIHLGGEYLLSNMFALRLGFKTTTISDLDFLSGLSAGIGFNMEKLGIDYAWVPYGVLGLFTHRISVTAKF